MNYTNLSDEAQAFLLELHSCAGTLPRSALISYCAGDADHRSTPCPLLDAYHETVDWRNYLGMDWDQWHALPVGVRADWLWRHLQFCFFRLNVYDVSSLTGALLIAGNGPTSWLVPTTTCKSFVESDSEQPLFQTGQKWNRAPCTLRELFKNARDFRCGHLITFAAYLKFSVPSKYKPFEFNPNHVVLDLSIAADPLAVQLRRVGMGLSPAPLLQLQQLIDAHQLLFREAMLTERETAMVRQRLHGRILSELRQHGRKVAPL